MRNMGGCGVIVFLLVAVATLFGWLDAATNGGPYATAALVLGVLVGLSLVGLAASKGNIVFTRSLMLFGVLGVCVAFANASSRAGNFEYRAARDLEYLLKNSPMVYAGNQYGGESFGREKSGFLDVSNGYEADCIRTDEGADCTVVHNFVTTDEVDTQVTMCFRRPPNGRSFELHTERPECSTIKTGTRS